MFLKPQNHPPEDTQTKRVSQEDYDFQQMAYVQYKQPQDPFLGWMGEKKNKGDESMSDGMGVEDGDAVRVMLQQVRAITESTPAPFTCTFCGAVLLPSETSRVTRDQLEGKPLCCSDCREYAIE